MLINIMSARGFILVVLVLLTGAGVNYHLVYGAPVSPSTTSTLFSPINLLGISVLRGNMLLEHFEMTSATTSSEYYLPSLSSANGNVYVIKVTAGEYYLTVYPASGEKIDQTTDAGFVIKNHGYFMVTADNPNGTWWIMSYLEELTY